MVIMAFKLYFNGCKKPYHRTCHGLKGNLHVSKSGSLAVFKSCLGYSSSVYTPYAHIKTAGQKKTHKNRLQGLFILNLLPVMVNQSPACLRYCTFISNFDSFKTDCMPRAKISYFIYNFLVHLP